MADAEAKTARAEISRDALLAAIADENVKAIARFLADAAIAGVKVKKVAMTLTADSEDVACEVAFSKMRLETSLGACAVDASTSRRRLLLTTTSYDVTIIVSPLLLDETTLEEALENLAAEGVAALTIEADPTDELRSIPGIDATLVESFASDAAAAAEATSTVNQSGARVPPPPPAVVVSNAALEASPEKSSAWLTAVAALIASGIIAPGTIFSIMAIFFKPLLRRKLLQLGWRRLADLVVPDVKTDVNLLSVKMDELNAFISKQKLPRLLDITPEIGAADMELDKKDLLGTGGYGAVFRATYNGAPVAVKALLGQDDNIVVPATIIKMMRREAKIMCSLNHPNILSVRGIVPERGWIVMELCDGGALDDWLQDPEEIIGAATKSRICSEIATGIAYLHMRDVSVVHGDLKAGNVLLTKGKSVRICDFGMSEVKNRSKTMTTAHHTGRTAFTVAWSAPELFEDNPKSSATDVFALGVTLWEVYERRVPFGNMPEAAVVNRILAGMRPKFTNASDIPATVKRIIEACWSSSANERPMADKVAYILTGMWTHHAGRSQEEAQLQSSRDSPLCAVDEADS